MKDPKGCHEGSQDILSRSTGLNIFVNWDKTDDFMAKQLGPLFITGTIGNLCCYEMEGQYYARKKSGLSRNKVLTHPNFERTRFNANLFAIASKIGSRVFRKFLKNEREHGLYRSITGEAMKLLKKDIDQVTVENILQEKYTKLLNEKRTRLVEKQIAKTNSRVQSVSPVKSRLFLEKHSEVQTKAVIKARYAVHRFPAIAEFNLLSLMMAKSRDPIPYHSP